MFKQMRALLQGKAHQAAEALAERNALVILDQQIRDAGAAIGQAKRALAIAIAQDGQEAERLAAASARIAGLESRARQALAAGREDLALLAAETIAELEMDQTAAAQARELFGAEIARLRASLREAERRFADLHRGRRLARVGEALRRTRDFAGTVGLHDAEATLAALRARQALEVAAGDALAQQDLSPKTIESRLGEAGFGAARPSAQTVLARLKPLAIARS